MAGFGDDIIRLDTATRTADSSDFRFGHHVFGGDGQDRFAFIGVAKSDQRITGRLDDFDPSRDSIWVDGRIVDLRHPPDNVRIVGYAGQQWLLIDERILYGLEGARHRSPTIAADNKNALEFQEDHFIDWPEEWAEGVPQSATITYRDPVNAVPAKYVPARPGNLNEITASDGVAEGTARADEIHGEQNVDNRLRGHGGRDYIWADRGDDTVSGGDGADTLDGFLGKDLLYGNAGDDIIDGNKSHDRIYGGPGRDTLSGGLDNDSISGGLGADLIFGGTEQDRLVGDHGADRIFGGSGADTLIGSVGEDRLRGGAGDDRIFGGGHGDLLIGHGGRDRLEGDAGADHLIGGSGRDTLAGGRGPDLLTGGAGADSFVFHAIQDAPRGSERDVITEFGFGDDKLHLTDMDADVSQSGDQAFSFSGQRPSAHSLWWVRSGDDVILRGDVTGDGRADFAIELSDLSSLRENDILL